MLRSVLLLIIAGLAPAADSLDLLHAVKNADRRALQTLIDGGSNVNVTQGDGATALHWASYRDDLESARLLIQAGANVNAANDLGSTPLWMACQNGSAAMAGMLLNAGANPNLALVSGETPLMTAARSGNPAVVTQLLAKDAKVNARATRGQTALMWAAAEKHSAVVKALLAYHADVHARSDVWSQVWQTGPEQDIHPDYHVKLQHGGETALLFAARMGDLESAKLLVEAGANVNDAAASGVTVVILAVHSLNADLVEFLLNKGADANAAKAGYTALHAAILRRNTAAVKLLLAHGADPNAKLRVSTPVRRSADDYYFHPAFIGATPFWLAARFSQPDVMRLLAKAGADPLFVHHVDYWGGKTSSSAYKRETPGPTTALMAALGMGRGAGFVAPDPAQRTRLALDAAKIAVELGIPVNAADLEGRTALETATALGYKDVVDFLASKGAKLDRPVRPLKKEAAEN